MIQVLLGLLDILAIAIIGLLTSISISGIQSQNTQSRILDYLPLIDFNALPFQSTVAILGACAALLMISKTILSMYLNRKILYFLSSRGAFISSKLITNILGLDLISLQNNSSQKIIYSVTSGVSSITLGVVGAAASLASDTSLLVLMGLSLFIYDPVMAIITLLIFGSIGFFLYKIMNVRIGLLGQQASSLTILSYKQITEALSSYREAFVRNRRSYYANSISAVRYDLADVSSKISFMPSVGKYVLELTLVVGALSVSAVQFIRLDAIAAISSMAVFMAASTRIAPAVLRVQQGLLTIKVSIGSAKPTLDMLDELKQSSVLAVTTDEIDLNHSGFIPKIEVTDLCFSYGDFPTIDNLSFTINSGETVAIVGDSGAGKSTLMDLLIGALSPSSGRIKISGDKPTNVINRYQGAIAYVPQGMVFIDGTIAENIRLGFPKDVIPDEIVINSLRQSELLDFVMSLPEGLNTTIGENGFRLSGGQRQRLGIARALATQPKLIFMDEATSALDTDTEYRLSNTLTGLDESVTLVLIAHRVSTIQHVNKVLYLDEGRMLAFDSLDNVKNKISKFNQIMSTLKD
jgi:ABC-type multidrug transport system fused ATPase/permease subunit